MPSRGPSTPWQRLRPVDLDPLEEMGLPSKGETRLLDHKTQERYYIKIVERYLSFCSDASDRNALLGKFAALTIAKQRGSSSGADSTAIANSASTDATTLHPTRTLPAASSSPSFSSSSVSCPSFPVPFASHLANNGDLSVVLMALRKLREGIVASKRIDDFATQVYLFCIRTAVLLKHSESYHPAILHLLRIIHPKHPLTGFELREVTGYLVLDAACRRDDLAEAFSLRIRFKLQDPKVDGILQALVRDDYIAFGRLKKTIDGHKAKFLEFREVDMRRHTLKCFGRSYLSVDQNFLETATGVSFLQLVEQEGVGWQSNGTKVTVRSIKGRTA
ncbi:hypothetical protein BD289DRAFT_806 [Coniella lustricola]|uniref:SAC3/GANP/Nin1/mts3/eIF-3 p25 family-domain-containing protein n=1 Tax=Coniella lustricola TaxID=2025994 RepID=A0A2T3ANA1_9PEZI|nr:hypothetical protein BD289DRAFT_806 [Coniella lustricola]